MSKRTAIIVYLLLVVAMLIVIAVKGVSVTPGSAQSAEVVQEIGSSFEN